MYTKDLTFLLRLLHTSKQSGILLVEPLEQGRANGLDWQGQFQLENGVVTSCLVRNKADGQVLRLNEEALHWLTLQGKLEWQMEEHTPSAGALLPSLPPPKEEPQDEAIEDLQTPLAWGKQLREIPQRTFNGMNVPVNALASRDHRQVFALVDGRRSIEEIVRLLHKPPDVVVRVLQELQIRGFIT